MRAPMGAWMLLGLSLLIACGEAVPRTHRPLPAEGAAPAGNGSAQPAASTAPSTTASASTSATTPVTSEVERPVGVAHEATRVVRISRSAERDVVLVVFVDDRAKDAPIAGLMVLDAATARVAYRPALDAALTRDGARVIYGRERAVESAPRLGIVVVPGADYEVAGSRRFAQPIVLDVTTGRERALKLAGGARWLAHGDEVLAWPRPAHHGAPGKPSALDLERGAWRPIADDVEPENVAKDPPTPTEGPIAFTRDGRLGVRWIDAEHIRAVRKEPR